MKLPGFGLLWIFVQIQWEGLFSYSSSSSSTGSSKSLLYVTFHYEGTSLSFASLLRQPATYSRLGLIIFVISWDV